MLNILGYYDKGKIFSQFRLKTWKSFIGHFIHLAEGDGGRGKIVILALYKFHFVRVRDNLNLDPSYKKKINYRGVIDCYLRRGG